MLGEVEGHGANHVTIENVFIEKICKQLFLTKLMMDIILRGRQSRIKDYTKVQKINNFSNFKVDNHL